MIKIIFKICLLSLFVFQPAFSSEFSEDEQIAGGVPGLRKFVSLVMDSPSREREAMSLFLAGKFKHDSLLGNLPRNTSLGSVKQIRKRYTKDLDEVFAEKLIVKINPVFDSCFEQGDKSNDDFLIRDLNSFFSCILNGDFTAEERIMICNRFRHIGNRFGDFICEKLLSRLIQESLMESRPVLHYTLADLFLYKGLSIEKKDINLVNIDLDACSLAYYHLSQTYAHLLTYSDRVHWDDESKFGTIKSLGVSVERSDLLDKQIELLKISLLYNPDNMQSWERLGQIYFTDEENKYFSSQLAQLDSPQKKFFTDKILGSIHEACRMSNHCSNHNVSYSIVKYSIYDYVKSMPCNVGPSSEKESQGPLAGPSNSHKRKAEAEKENRGNSSKKLCLTASSDIFEFILSEEDRQATMNAVLLLKSSCEDDVDLYSHGHY